MEQIYQCRECGQDFIAEESDPPPRQCPGCLTAPLPATRPDDFEAPIIPPTEPPPPKLHPMAPYPTEYFPPHLAALGDKLGPRRRRARPTGMPRRLSSALIFLGLSTAAIVGLMLLKEYTGVGFGQWFWGPGSELRWLPDNCQIIVGVNVKSLESSDVFREVREALVDADSEMAERFDKGTLAPSKVERFLIGGPTNNPSELIAVCRMRHPVTPDAVLGEYDERFTESQEGRHTLYIGTREAFCMPAPNIVVRSIKAETLRKVVARDGSPTLSREINRGLDHADFSKAFTLVLDVKNLPNRQLTLRSLPHLGGQARQVDHVDSLTLQADAKKSVTMRCHLLCGSVSAAEGVAGAIEEGLQSAMVSRDANQALRNILDTSSVHARGVKVTATVVVPADPLVASTTAVLQLQKTLLGK
jgi:hypothetical protein